MSRAQDGVIGVCAVVGAIFLILYGLDVLAQLLRSGTPVSATPPGDWRPELGWWSFTKAVLVLVGVSTFAPIIGIALLRAWRKRR